MDQLQAILQHAEERLSAQHGDGTPKPSGPSISNPHLSSCKAGDVSQQRPNVRTAETAPKAKSSLSKVRLPFLPWQSPITSSRVNVMKIQSQSLVKHGQSPVLGQFSDPMIPIFHSYSDRLWCRTMRIRLPTMTGQSLTSFLRNQAVNLAAPRGGLVFQRQKSHPKSKITSEC